MSAQRVSHEQQVLPAGVAQSPTSILASGTTVSAAAVGDVGWIVLHAEKVHVLTEAFPRELEAAARAVSEERTLRAVILTGTSRVFCAGADLSLAGRLRQPGFGRWWLESHNRSMLALAEIPRPVIAAVNGAAAGAGFNLALACDFVLASREATFLQAFIRIGLATDMGSCYLLPRRVGHQRARELMYSGRTLSADEALAIGAVDEVVDPEQLLTRASEWAAELASAPTVALSAIKRGLAAGEKLDLADSLRLEAELQMDVLASHDFQEGTTAFLERRAPRFTGT